jgi:putative hydrolase of the HAD superfamily
MIRAVFFDLDGTLYDRDAAILSVAQSQFDAFRKQFGHVTQSAFVERLVEMDSHGHNRTPRLHHELSREFGLPDSLGDDLETFFRTHYPKYCLPTDDTRQTLTSLRERGLKTGLITNGPTDWQSRKVEAMNIAHLFDTILISESEGVGKPDVRIFERALERCAVAASESLFVGDHPEADIRGAQAAGLRPVWKRMDYWSVPEGVPRIDRISEILPLIS